MKPTKGKVSRIEEPMDEVKRYDMALSPSSDIGQGGYELVRDYGDDGANVDYTDYAKLEAERDTLEIEMEEYRQGFYKMIKERDAWKAHAMAWQNWETTTITAQALRYLGVME